MDMFVIVGWGTVAPEARWTLEAAQSAVRDLYSGSELEFHEDILFGGPKGWMAYNWSNVSADGQAQEIAEKIVMIDVPGLPPEIVRPQLPFDAAARMELRVTTREGVTSMEHIEPGAVWEGSRPVRGTLIETFAAHAGRALADHLTKGDPR